MKLEIKNISKNYGKVAALRGVNITLNPGIYGILGPNGAGKSTLINLITDNIARQAGEILADGTEIKKMGKDYRDIIGYMPQSQGFYNDFTVTAFLMYMARLKDMNKRDAKERVAELIEILNLEAKAKSRISGLSGGMKQRLMLAQALLNNPKILILDEPTAGVDPQERIQIRNYISTLSRDRIVIIATHIVSDVEAIANKIYLIGGGRVIKQGAPEELIQNIADKVYDISVDYEEIQRIQEKYVVGNISSRTDGIHVKIISDNVPEEYAYERCAANLEDVYLEAFAV